jgi:CelD/BcsL family acetyltransferase involved in cellulose biosynthesis
MTVLVRQPAFSGYSSLGEAWTSLEARAHASFFQTWTWVGCLAEERYPDPVLLSAERGGETVGLALFNRRRRVLHLAESGDPALDRPFIEHNGPLATDAEAAAALLAAAWKVPGIRRLGLSGVPPAVLAMAGKAVVRRQDRQAPFLDLAPLRVAGTDILTQVSANARQQIRRAMRHYGGEDALVISAAGPAEIGPWLQEAIKLNDATWRRRGQPGAFATDYLRRFHSRLMERALARGELDLLRIASPRGVVGILYNLRFRGVAYAYQSALCDPTGHPHAKPGLVCHTLAIRRSVAMNDTVYDFLAGDQRYKRSFADGDETLCWAELASPWSVPALMARFRQRHWE